MTPADSTIAELGIAEADVPYGGTLEPAAWKYQLPKRAGDPCPHCSAPRWWRRPNRRMRGTNHPMKSGHLKPVFWGHSKLVWTSRNWLTFSTRQ
jgi:hypothetical protein